MEYKEIREQICDVCHKMWQLGWVAANDGNVSVKLEDGNFLVTPTGISKSFITPEKLVIIDKDMNVVSAEGNYKPSSEIKMHMRCYTEREDVGAVVHAHPPTATGYAVAGKSLDEYSMIETVIAIGSIPLTPYGTPSTNEVPEAIAPYLKEHDVLLLQNHGALTVGCDHCKWWLMRTAGIDEMIITGDADWFHIIGITPALSDKLEQICLETVKTAKKARSYRKS